MKKLKRTMLSLAILVTMAVPSLGIGLNVDAYTVEKQLIGDGAPAGYTYSNDYVILHESGNPSNSGPDSLTREVSYMTNNWRNAFVSHWVGGGGRVVQLAKEGAYQYGAGRLANERSYAQIELARTNDRKTFEADYKAYVNLARDLAKRAGIPKTLDTAGQGIKSHRWVTLNLWGDHLDPFDYLQSWGVSATQLAKDLSSGFTIPSVPDVDPETPNPGTDTPVPTNPWGTVAQDGQWGPGLTTALQKYYGSGTVDGEVSGQIKTSANQNVYAAQWGRSGSNLIRVFQMRLRDKGWYSGAIDGNLGPATVKALQRAFGTTQDGIISPTSNLVTAMQKSLNANQMPF